MNSPLVSILIPSYNHERFVAETLDSIAAQTYENIEVVIVDDGSKDNSVNVIQNYIANSAIGERIHFSHRPNKGLAKTLNELMDKAKGDYFVIFASDDTLLPTAISTLVGYAEKNSSAAVVGDAYIINQDSKCILVNPMGQVVEDTFGGKKFGRFLAWRTYNKFGHRGVQDLGKYVSLLSSNYVPNGVLLRRSVLEEVGKFDEDLLLQDHEYWLRLCREHKIDFVPETLSNYRIHGENTIYRFSDRIQNDWVQILIREHQYCRSFRMRFLWYYAMSVALLRMIQGLKSVQIKRILREANPLIVLVYLPFVVFRKAFLIVVQ